MEYLFSSVTLGSNVKKIRNSLGISNYSFYSKLHISDGYLRSIESGKLPSIELSIDIANKLKVGINELFDETPINQKNHYIKSIISDLNKLDEKEKRKLLMIAKIMNGKVDAEIEN